MRADSSRTSAVVAASFVVPLWAAQMTSKLQKYSLRAGNSAYTHLNVVLAGVVAAFASPVVVAYATAFDAVGNVVMPPHAAPVASPAMRLFLSLSDQTINEHACACASRPTWRSSAFVDVAAPPMPVAHECAHSPRAAYPLPHAIRLSPPACLVGPRIHLYRKCSKIVFISPHSPL